MEDDKFGMDSEKVMIFLETIPKKSQYFWILHLKSLISQRKN